MFTRITWTAIALVVPTLFAQTAGRENIAVVDRPPVGGSNQHYVSNRSPLAPTALVRLPVGAVRPRGWLRKQLELQAAGFIGQLGEISSFLKKDGNAWLAENGLGHSNWEELPYWLKGFGDMAYLLNDEKLIAEARVWIDGAIGSQRSDGYFGPRANLTALKTDSGDKPDLWPNMVMLNALQSYYEWGAASPLHGPDPRVITLMTHYFKWQLEFPEADFLLPFWQQQRAADNLASVYWLYNRTGDAWLLDLAKKIHRRTANWTDGVANWHGVNISQSFRGPAVFWQQSHEQRLLDAVYRNYDTVMNLYGQVPGGMFGADENCRRGLSDPRQAAESCTMVEFMYSFEQLLAITGDATWADRCEEIAFNSLPAALTADFKAVRYLTSPNMISSDARSKAPGYENGGPMQLFDPRDHRCCQHNVAHGWPYFCESLWMATCDNGLAATMYAPCQVKAKVGDGVEVTIVEETQYPFREEVRLTISPSHPVRFPLYLRVPRWAETAWVVVNKNEEKPFGRRGGKFIVVDREWRTGDEVELIFTFSRLVERWPKNHDSVSLRWGALVFALDLDEKAKRVREDDLWPATEVWPGREWNYGIDVRDADQFLDTFFFPKRYWPADDQPFTPQSAPIEMRGRMRRIPEWQEDHLGLVGVLQPGPAKTSEPAEPVRLIPMGAARLRISQFPLASDAADAKTWKAPQKPRPAIPANSSHCWREDTLTALSDGLDPASSDDFNVPRFTWWDHRGTTEWVQYDFEKPKRVSRVEVYWFDDTGRGRCRTPKNWRVLYRSGEQWKPVAARGEPGTEKDRYNVLAFEPVETSGLRLEVELRPEFSGGILEWRVE